MDFDKKTCPGEFWLRLITDLYWYVTIPKEKLHVKTCFLLAEKLGKIEIEKSGTKDRGRPARRSLFLRFLINIIIIFSLFLHIFHFRIFKSYILKI